MWDCVGQMPDADHPADSVCSYSSVYDVLSAKSKSFVEKYQQFVISYVVEWEKTVTTRVNAGMKKVEDQRRELNHYQKKVESLRLSTNKTMAQGKSVKSDRGRICFCGYLCIGHTIIYSSYLIVVGSRLGF